MNTLNPFVQRVFSKFLDGRFIFISNAKINQYKRIYGIVNYFKKFKIYLIVFFSAPQFRKLLDIIERNPEYDVTRCSKDPKAWAPLANALNKMSQTDKTVKHAVKTAEKWQSVCFLYYIGPFDRINNIFVFSPIEG